MRWPRGLPGGNLPSNSPGKRQGKGFQLQELQFSQYWASPKHLFLYACKSWALIPKPTFKNGKSRWAAPSPFPTELPAVIQLLGGQHARCRRFVASAGSEGLLLRLQRASQPHTSGEELLEHSRGSCTCTSYLFPLACFPFVELRF